MNRRRVVALVDDIMVRSRIEASAPETVELLFPTSAADFAASLDPPPELVLVGLAATRLPWADLVRQLRANPATRGARLLAFGPHKDLTLRRQALEAGVGRVLANSAFMLALPDLLRGRRPAC